MSHGACFTVAMPILSKSKLIAYRQCPKRLWLEVHRPELREDSASTEARYAIGHSVGEIAKKIFDPDNKGVEINAQRDGYPAALAESQRHLEEQARPIFEAGISAAGAIAFADIMLPDPQGGWKMIEVKSSTTVKDYHRDDVAVQSYAAHAAGVRLLSVGVACIDSSWVYRGDGDYRGLLRVEDLTVEAKDRSAEVRQWISNAETIVANASEPEVLPGPHCETPFACGFCDYCNRNVPQPEFPLTWLPRLHPTRRDRLRTEGIDDIRHVPDHALNLLQQRVKQHTLANTVFFDATGARADLADHGLPARFMDFETVMLAVPIWAGTRPYQQIPFQFSLHTVSGDRKLAHESFLDISGRDPSEAFVRALVAACGDDGPIYVYNASFEASRLRELADRFPEARNALTAILARIVDVLPIVRDRYYHPSQQGSWSIKAVLPAAVPELSYEALEGIQDGSTAMDAFAEAINPATSEERRAEIEKQLHAYCRLDTYAMVRLWQFLQEDKIPLVEPTNS